MFNLNQNKKTYWHFKDISPEKFTLVMVLNVETDYIKNLFDKNSKTVTGEEVIKQVEDLKKFKFDSSYKALMKTAIAGKIKEINGELKKKGVEMLTYELSDESHYTKIADTFTSYFFIEGFYKKL